MKISIITVSYNSKDTIRDTIESVLKQKYEDIEHIIVDGASKDETLDIIRSYSHLIWVSENDSGLYDAMNKGIQMATGDVIGILNSDDFFQDDNILTKVAENFCDADIDVVFGDVSYVDPRDLKKVVRNYSSSSFNPEKFKFGYMPAHPSFYVRRKYYDQYGLYKLDYKIAADFELLVRFLYVNKLRYIYLPEVFVCMRTGGVSNRSFLNRHILNLEIRRACNENGVKTNMAKILLRYFTKIFEFKFP